ncbi:hypothetical protein BC832DRAFT_568614 [Gaertneriomyces semiglobifer]|nr:hypothetical protein BC832DRAFT_568614 [Gaertneriomyces semiglobifer]
MANHCDSDGLYLMLQIGRVTLPLCCKDLLYFIDEIGGQSDSKYFCDKLGNNDDVTLTHTERMADFTRPTLDTPTYKSMIRPTKSRLRKSFIRH